MQEIKLLFVACTVLRKSYDKKFNSSIIFYVSPSG